ncbi:MAG: sigma 54-interacting transcriptional regulator [Peptococcaceae bacterium]|jgi:transcriptional regulator of acetoin/glycerol metabolism|nr:sigma 54-interacting transcriptional regulator [Peptococcaceae bacterium]
MNMNASVNYFDNPAQYIESVKKDWERFISHGETAGLSVRKEVLRSWEFSLKNRVAYEDARGIEPIFDSEKMSRLYAQKERLVRAAQPVVEDLAALLMEQGKTGGIINLCDEDAVIMATKTSGLQGDMDAEQQRLLPGMILDEPYSGTTGVSMAKKTGQPYAIYGSEHFNLSAKAYCCAAVPIKNHKNGSSTGFLALSGKNLNITPETLGMVMFAAKAIENALSAETPVNLPADSEVRLRSGRGLDKPPVLVGSAPNFITAVETAKKMARSDAPILLLGETGTGKDVFAKMIHFYSNRADKPFFAVNCGAIPRELIGSELFGYAPGTFTGGLPKGNPGKIESANGGTVFLDELGEMSPEAQVYLLRVIEEKALLRLGGNRLIPADVRIIAATNANFKKLLEEKKFREDLYYRLSVLEINIPPFRDRLDDLASLTAYFHSLYCGRGRGIREMKAEDLNYLRSYSWPGNLRELKSAVQRANVLGADTVESLKDYVKSRKDEAQPERYARFGNYARIMEECEGNVSEAARRLGVARSTIYRRMRQK